ncbi:hypothetical protein KAR91_26465 [Candidatus Pacearchaeota archaeon]|nr:hypothetical protein [Candidatus Pacearchaeota archaeon]
MSPQLAVKSQQDKGFPGLIDGLHAADIISRINNSKQTIDTTISAADAATTLTINGTAFAVNVGAGVLTKTELRDLLIAAINAGSEPVTASINDADQLYVEADVSGVAFTYADTANVSSADLILNDPSVEFGLVVVQDDEKGSAKESLAHLPSITTDISDVFKVLGVAVHQHTVEQAKPTSGNLGYPPQSEMSIMKKGRVWVQTEVTVLSTDTPFVRFSASGTEKRGAFRNDADTADAVALPNSRFLNDSEVVNGINLVLLGLNLV